MLRYFFLTAFFLNAVTLHDMVDPALEELAIKAAEEGDLAALCKLVPRFLPVDATDYRENSLVDLAVSGGHENVVTWLLNQGASPCRNSPNERSTLCVAVPYPGILQKLLPYRFSDSQRYEALRCASNGPLASLKILLNSGISPNNNWAPLQGATQNGCWECAQMLLDAGAIGDEHPALHIGEDSSVVISNGLAGLFSFASDHNTCLSGTYTRHDEMMEIAQKLLQRRPLQGELECNEALFCASFTDCPHLLSLIRSALDRPIGFWPEIRFAIKWGDIEGLNQLIQLKNEWQGVGPNPFDLNQQNNFDHRTPLFYLVQISKSPIRLSAFKLLVENGADPNIRGTSSFSAIESAANEGDLEMVGLLIDAGAEWCPEFGTEGTFIQKVVESDYRDILNLLLRKGASLPAIEEAFAQSYGSYRILWEQFLESLHEEDLPIPP